MSKSEGSLGERLIVILLAAGVVALGYQPFKKQYGGIIKYVKERTQAIAGEIPFGLGKSSAPTGPRALPPETNPAQQKKLDDLSTKDRKALNTLLDKL